MWTYLEACNCECSIVEEDDSVADGIDIEEGASARVTALEQLSRKVLLFVAEYAGEEVLVVLFGKGGKAGLGGTTSAAATEWPKARQCVAPFSAANTRRWPAPCRPSLPHCAKHTGGWHCARFLPKANPPKRPLPLSSALSYYNPSLLNRKVEMKCISHLGEAIAAPAEQQALLRKAFQNQFQRQVVEVIGLRRVFGDPFSQFCSCVVGGNFGGVVLDESDACAFVDIKPSLVLPFLFGERVENALLVLGVELPVEYGNIAVIELVGGITHDVLVEHHSLRPHCVLFLVEVELNELLPQMVSYQVQSPTVSVENVVQVYLLTDFLLEGALERGEAVDAALPVVNETANWSDSHLLPKGSLSVLDFGT